MTAPDEPRASDVAAVQAAAQQSAGVMIMPDGTVQDLQTAQAGTPGGDGGDGGDDG